MAAAAERHYLDRARPRAIAAVGHRDHPPRPRRADAADQGGRSRPSRSRRSRAEGRRGQPAARRGGRGRRSLAGAVVGRRLGELDRAGRRRVVCAEAAGDAGAAALGRADRRDQHGPEAFVADQGRPAGARRPARRDRDARRSRTCRATTLPRSPRGRRCRIRPPWRMHAPSSRNTISSVDDAVRRALDDPDNESCKPGDAAFAHARFELIARPRALARRRDPQGAPSAAGYDIIDLGADLEGEARDVAADHPKLALQARGARQARGDPVRRRTHRGRLRGNGRGGPNQEYALALAELLKDTSGISALAADTDGADGGGGSATDPAGAIIDDVTFSMMASLRLDPENLSRQQQRHGLLRGDWRSVADRPDADQRE